MPLRHIVAATSDSDEGRAALQTATSLGQRVAARVTVLAVAQEPLKENGLASLTRSLRETVARQLESLSPPHPTVHFAVQFGLPGVEIGRFADGSDADLVVVGRGLSHPPGETTGETTDAVARRSRVPCLFVPPGGGQFDHLLVALDGTERGLAVLQNAVEFARATRARVRAVTVEPATPERDIPWVHTGRTERVSETLGRMRAVNALPPEQWDFDSSTRLQPLLVRRGRVVEEVLNEVALERTDVLVLGCHRGGPSATGDRANIPQQLMHRSSCAVLTIPL